MAPGRRRRSPRRTVANLFSYLARGDVALNVTLTAINTLLAVVTIPIVVNLSARYFAGESGNLGLPPSQVLPIIAIVIVPIGIGMVVRSRRPRFAERMTRPVQIGSMLVLALVVVAAIVQAWDVLLAHITVLGSLSLVLSTIMLGAGYGVPRLFRVNRSQSIASAMEVGLQNAALAITIALSLMNRADVAVSAAVYGVVMFLPATAAAYLLARRASRAPAPGLEAARG